MTLLSLLVVVLLPLSSIAVPHTLFVTSERAPQIFALSFDPDTNALSLLKTINGHGGAKWLSLSADRSALYTAERDGWSSYRVVQPDGLEYMNSIPQPYCPAQDSSGKGGPALLVSPRQPYPVYGATAGKCSVVMTTKPDGSFDRIAQNLTFHASSRIGGMAIEPHDRYLFGADTGDSGLWVHRINQQTGLLDEGGVLDFPIDDGRPRRIVIHKAGRYAYVLLQKLCQIAIFELIERGGGRPRLRFTNTTISLIPGNVDAKDYRATEIVVSDDGRLLYGTVRYQRRDRDQDSNDSNQNYVQTPPLPARNSFGGSFGGAFTGRSKRSIQENAESKISKISNDGTRTQQSPQPAAPESTAGLDVFAGILGIASLPVDIGMAAIGATGCLLSAFFGGCRAGPNQKGESHAGGPPSGPGDMPMSMPAPMPNHKRSLDDWVIENTITMLQKDQADEVRVDIPGLKKRASTQNANTGFLTGVLLADSSTASKGAPLSILLQAGTSSTGGRSNVIAPAPGVPGLFALMDSEQGKVQMWKLDGLGALPLDGPKGEFQLSSQNSGKPDGDLYGSVQIAIVNEWRAPPEFVGDTSKRNGRDDDFEDSRFSRVVEKRQFQGFPPRGNRNFGFPRPQPRPQPPAGAFGYPQPGGFRPPQQGGFGYPPPPQPQGGYRYPPPQQGGFGYPPPPQQGFGNIPTPQQGGFGYPTPQASPNFGFTPQTNPNLGFPPPNDPNPEYPPPSNTVPDFSSEPDPSGPIPSGRGCCANAIWLT